MKGKDIHIPNLNYMACESSPDPLSVTKSKFIKLKKPSMITSALFQKEGAGGENRGEGKGRGPSMDHAAHFHASLPH